MFEISSLPEYWGDCTADEALAFANELAHMMTEKFPTNDFAVVIGQKCRRNDEYSEIQDIIDNSYVKAIQNVLKKRGS